MVVLAVVAVVESMLEFLRAGVAVDGGWETSQPCFKMLKNRVFWKKSKLICPSSAYRKTPWHLYAV